MRMDAARRILGLTALYDGKSLVRSVLAFASLIRITPAEAFCVQGVKSLMIVLFGSGFIRRL